MSRAATRARTGTARTVAALTRKEGEMVLGAEREISEPPFHNLLRATRSNAQQLGGRRREKIGPADTLKRVIPVG